MKKKDFEKDKPRDKIQILSEIDQLQVVANNHLLMKKYYEAIKVSETIIKLAKEADLPSIIKEQEKFVLKISRLIDDSKIGFMDEDFLNVKKNYESKIQDDDLNSAHYLLEEFRRKFNNIIDLNSIPNIKDLLEKDKSLWKEYSKKQKSLKGQLGPLDIQFNSYMKTNNLNLAEETLKKAKEILRDIKDETLQIYWQDHEIELIELKSNRNIKERVKELLLDISKYMDSYQFVEGRKAIDEVDKLLKNRNFPKLKKEFGVKRKALFDAEEKYNKLSNDLNSLEENIKDHLSNGLFSKAMSDCEQIIKVSRFIGQKKYVEMYTQLLNEIKQKMRKYYQLEEVKNIIKSLKEEALKALQAENYEKSLKLFKEMREHLTKHSNA